MRRLVRRAARGGALLAAAGAAACAAAPAPERVYGRTDVVVIADDVVGVLAEMRGAADRETTADYARCVAAGYVLERGFAFARHLRTTVVEDSGVWRADALYSVAPGLPAGLRRIDAEVTVADCRARGVPTA
jgi:hypothetical protein